MQPPRSRAINPWHSLHQQAGCLCLVCHDLRVRKPVGGWRRTATLRVLVKFTFEGSSRRECRRRCLRATDSGFGSCRSGEAEVVLEFEVIVELVRLYEHLEDVRTAPVDDLAAGGHGLES